MSESWVTIAACSSLPQFCMWSGPASEARRDSATGDLKCPKCSMMVTTWQVDQVKEMAALRQEQAARADRWWTVYQANEARLAAQRIASDNAKMRGITTADVVARRGGGRYAREEREHLQELIRRAMAAREE
jgi:hypothetical protein